MFADLVLFQKLENKVQKAANQDVLRDGVDEVGEECFDDNWGGRLNLNELFCCIGCIVGDRQNITEFFPMQDLLKYSKFNRLYRSSSIKY